MRTVPVAVDPEESVEIAREAGLPDALPVDTESGPCLSRGSARPEPSARRSPAALREQGLFVRLDVRLSA